MSARSNSNGGNGPDLRNLRKLSTMLPQYVRERARGKIVGMGKNPKTPANVCRICAALWGAGRPEDPFRHLVCDNCQKRLDGGETAIVSGNRFAWVVSKTLRDDEGKGQIFHVTPDTLDAIEKKHHEDHPETQAKDPPTDR